MKKSYFLFFSIIFLFPLNIINGEIYSLETMSFIPPMYYIGDEVELRISIIIPENLQIKEPENKIEKKWVEINKVSITLVRKREDKKIYDVNIFFRAFKPGKLFLPKLDLGSLSLSDIEINTLSVLEKDKITKLRPLRGQLVLPHTWFKIGLIFAFIILTAILILVFFKFSFKGFNFFNSLNKRNVPRRKLLKDLENLKTNIQDIKPRDFFIKISDTFKEYLSARLSIPVYTSTTYEISHLTYYNVLEKEISGEIVNLFSFSDLVKFGDKYPSRKDMEDIITKIIFLSHSIEEEKKNVEP